MTRTFREIRKATSNRIEALETYAREAKEAYPAGVMGRIPFERRSPEARLLVLEWRVVARDNFSTITVIAGALIPFLGFFARDPDYIEFTTYHPAHRKEILRMRLLRLFSFVPNALGITLLIVGVLSVVMGVIGLLVRFEAESNGPWWAIGLGIAGVVASFFLRRIASLLAVPPRQRHLAQSPFELTSLSVIDPN